MFSPRAYTIVIATLDCLARVDLRAGKSLQVVYASRRNRHEDMELGGAVGAALRLGPARRGRVYVLCDDVWSGLVCLDDQVLAAVPENQLEQTLALEAEQASGYSPFDTCLAYVPQSTIDGRSAWWVAQAPTAQLSGAAAAVPKAAGRLVGIAPLAIAPPSADGDRQHVWDTGSTEACQALAQAWLAAHLADRANVPVIASRHAGWSESQQRRAGMLVAAAALAVCAAVHHSESRAMERAESERTRLAATEKQMRQDLVAGEQRVRQAQQRERQHQAARAAIAERREMLRRRANAEAAMRLRPVQLLRALAATADPNHCVQGVELRDARAVISGVALDSASVARLAQRLEWELGPQHWQIQPANMTTASAQPLVRFELALAQGEGDHGESFSVSSRNTPHDR